jgi:glycosyltransferase involved in cell wall biosynthesis
MKADKLMEAPIFIAEWELTEPIRDIALPERLDGTAYNGTYLLVRLQHVPVGYAFLPSDSLEAAAIARQVWNQLSAVINTHYERAGLPAIDGMPVGGLTTASALEDGTTDRPLVSVVVCTRNRPESILVTLRSLLDMHYQPFEILLVDNAPSSNATKDAVLAAYGEDPRIRYVREPRPGLSCARNRGLAEASADIVAFTDDDVTVDPWWLDGIVRGFRAAPNVACVTGMIATAQLENAEQLYFHLREAWGAVCERRIFDLSENRDDSLLYPYSAGIFGAGANFAVSRVFMKEIGEFNEALGAGTVSGGGEDLEMFMRIILSGNRIVYEPAAITSHYHRTELAELTRQMRAYGTGNTAALAAVVLRVPRARRELPLRIVHGMRRISTLNDRVKDNPTLPQGLMRTEIKGLLVGPWLYLKGRRRIPAKP